LDQSKRYSVTKMKEGMVKKESGRMTEKKLLEQPEQRCTHFRHLSTLVNSS